MGWAGMGWAGLGWAGLGCVKACVLTAVFFVCVYVCDVTPRACHHRWS